MYLLRLSQFNTVCHSLLLELASNTHGPTGHSSYSTDLCNGASFHGIFNHSPVPSEGRQSNETPWA